MMDKKPKGVVMSPDRQYAQALAIRKAADPRSRF
jgi:hypothetical protein